MKINPLQAFENFIPSAYNENTYEVLKDLSTSKEVQYNPIFLYSEIGLGKSHLVQAVVNASKHNNIVYQTSESFLNDFVKHIRAKEMEEFRDKYRNCDLLIIEDIQFLQNKEIIQEELLYTLGSLIPDNKQVIFTSSIEIEEFEGIDKHLKNYICGGLMLDILPYDIDTRKEIVELKAQEMHLVINDNDIEEIAENYDYGIRSIIGVLNNYAVHGSTDSLAQLRKDEIILERKNCEV